MSTRLLRASLPYPSRLVDTTAARLAAKRLYDPFALDGHGTCILAMGDETIDGRESAWLDISITV